MIIITPYCCFTLRNFYNFYTISVLNPKNGESNRYTFRFEQRTRARPIFFNSMSVNFPSSKISFKPFLNFKSLSSPNSEVIYITYA